MLVAKIQVSGTCAKTIYAIPITAGMIGGKVEILYSDPVWDGLSKTVVFQGAGTKDVLTQDQLVTIPAEVIAQDHVRLKVGIYGTDAEGVLAIPTLWAELGTVQPGADPSGDITTDPSLPVWAQLQGMIGDPDDLDTDMKISLVAAVNEALTKGGGSVDEAEIQRIVDEYLAANPPTVTETDPTVPEWAKQPEKPTYTAAEVGALSDETLPAAINTALAQAKDSGEFDGKDGDPGAPGADGYSPTASVMQTDTGAVITITDKTGTTTATLKNGADGQPGATGQTPNIQIGTVETLEAGSQATASMGGTLENPILNLGIPQGAPGSGGGGGIAVTGATVGQTIRVAAVDDDGVPTAWEPVDFPSGGGGEADPPLLVDYTVPDDSTASIIEFTSDDNGIAFNLNNRCYFVVDAIFPDSTSKTIGIVSNGVSQGAGPFSPGNRLVTVTEVHIFGKYTRDFGTRYTTWVQYRPYVNYGYPTNSNTQFGQSDLALLMENTRGTAVKSLRFHAMGTGDTIYWAPGTRVRIWGD